VKRAALTQPFTASVGRGKRQVCPHSCLDLNGNIRTSSPVAGDSWEGAEAHSCHRENAALLEDFELRSEQSQRCTRQGRRLTCTLTSVLVVYSSIWVIWLGYMQSFDLMDILALDSTKFFIKSL